MESNKKHNTNDKFVWSDTKALRYAQWYANNPKWFTYKGTIKSRESLAMYKDAYVYEIEQAERDAVWEVHKAIKVLEKNGYQITKTEEI